jgi:hypothetical protein
MGWRNVVMVGGPLVSAVYAAAMTLLITVWDPAAAVPSMEYPQIVGALRAAGVDMTATYFWVCAWGAAGVGLALIPSFLLAKRALGVRDASGFSLLVIAAGAPAYFVGSFSLGMDVADTFGVSGGDHTALGGVLYLVSAVSFATLVSITVVRAVRAIRATRRADRAGLGPVGA